MILSRQLDLFDNDIDLSPVTLFAKTLVYCETCDHFWDEECACECRCNSRDGWQYYARQSTDYLRK